MTLHLENTSLKALTICTSGESGSHECSNSVAHKSLKPTKSTLEHGGGFEISFTEYVKEISIITLPSHRRRDKKSQITPLDLSQLRVFEWSVALVGYAMFATAAGTSVAVDGKNTSSHSGHDL